MRLFYSIILISSFIACIDTTKKRVLNCESEVCFFDSIAISYMRDTIEIMFLRNGKVSLVDKFLALNENEYFFYQDSLTLDQINFYDYKYLLFSKEDTVFYFNFDDLDTPPIFPIGSNRWRVEIFSQNGLRVTRKTSVLNPSFQYTYFYVYPLDIKKIEVNGVTGLNKSIYN
jgi:hypothetical protein